MSGEIPDSTNVELPITDEIRDIIDVRTSAQTPVSGPAGMTILNVTDLKMYFPVTKGLLKRTVGFVKAVDGVSFTIRNGETFGIVGESGSGKTTLGHCVIRNYRQTAGQVLYKGRELSELGKKEMRALRREITLITQDPYASLNPRMSVRDIILEGPEIHGILRSAAGRRDLVSQMLELVGLNRAYANRYPHEFSGGQRQRVSIARALALNPAFIVCDEVVSALDVSIQSQIIGLLQSIQEKLGVTYVFIGHDLSVVRHISNHIAVMYLGKFMELTDSDRLYDNPLHPYTKALISAAPIPDPEIDRARQRIILKGDIPSPIDPPKGCGFCTRCNLADKRCENEAPEFRDVGGGHYVACFKVH